MSALKLAVVVVLKRSMSFWASATSTRSPHTHHNPHGYEEDRGKAEVCHHGCFHHHSITPAKKCTFWGKKGQTHKRKEKREAAAKKKKAVCFHSNPKTRLFPSPSCLFYSLSITSFNTLLCVCVNQLLFTTSFDDGTFFLPFPLSPFPHNTKQPHTFNLIIHVFSHSLCVVLFPCLL